MENQITEEDIAIEEIVERERESMKPKPFLLHTTKKLCKSAPYFLDPK